MNLRMAALLGAAATLAVLATPATAVQARDDRSSPFATDATQRSFAVSGRVVSIRENALVVRIDDHGHAMSFSIGPGVQAKVKAGDRVVVRYHPSGDTGQVADEVSTR